MTRRARFTHTRRNLDCLLPLLIGLGLLYAAYFVWRYGGLWAENDSATFTNTIEQMIRAGSVLYPGQYVHGFGYPDWVGMIALATGMSVPVLTSFVMPFIGAVLMVVASYVAYSAMTGSHTVGALGVLLVLAVPELMFTVLRGNHEKLNVFLMAGALYGLLRVVRAFRGVDRLLWLGVIYLCALLNVAANDYFGTTFAVACTLMLLVAYGLHMRSRGPASLGSRRRAALSRVAIVALGAWFIAWVFILYIYPPARQDLSLLTSSIARLQNLALTLHATSDPYAGLAQSWASPLLARLMSLFRWVVFVGSATYWFSQIWGVLVQRRPMGVRGMWMLSLYTAFSMLVAVAIPVDMVGLSAGSNLEVRDYTYFALFAAPMLALGVWKLLRRNRTAPPVVRGRSLAPVRGWLQWSTGVVLIILIAGGSLKTTLDPVVSNDWIFYRESELQAVRAFWHTSQGQVMWVGPDDRLAFVSEIWIPGSAHRNAVEGYQALPGTEDYLVSPAVTAATRIADMPDPWPPGSRADRVYDNGSVQIYRRLPKTPFQQ